MPGAWEMIVGRSFREVLSSAFLFVSILAVGGAIGVGAGKLYIDPKIDKLEVERKDVESKLADAQNVRQELDEEFARYKSSNAGEISALRAKNEHLTARLAERPPTTIARQQGADPGTPRARQTRERRR